MHSSVVFGICNKFMYNHHYLNTEHWFHPHKKLSTQKWFISHFPCATLSSYFLETTFSVVLPIMDSSYKEIYEIYSL